MYVLQSTLGLGIGDFGEAGKYVIIDHHIGSVKP